MTNSLGTVHNMVEMKEKVVVTITQMFTEHDPLIILQLNWPIPFFLQFACLAVSGLCYSISSKLKNHLINANYVCIRTQGMAVQVVYQSCELGQK